MGNCRPSARTILFPAHLSIVPSPLALAADAVIGVARIRVEVIATPDHMPGHVSYLINDEVLCVGDTLNLENGKVIAADLQCELLEKLRARADRPAGVRNKRGRKEGTLIKICVSLRGLYFYQRPPFPP